MVLVLWECGMQHQGSASHQQLTFSDVRVRLSLFLELVKFLWCYSWTSFMGAHRRIEDFKGMRVFLNLDPLKHHLKCFSV